jgi:hypothetical protein
VAHNLQIMGKRMLSFMASPKKMLSIPVISALVPSECLPCSLLGPLVSRRAVGDKVGRV